MDTWLSGKVTKDVWESVYPNHHVAWPTLLLFCLVIVFTSAILGGAVVGKLAEIAAVLLLTLCAYAMFSVMHEAVHGSIFQSRWANSVIGTVASVWMGPTSSFSAYRSLHLEHHRYTNDPRLDPDSYNATGPHWWLPISWLTTDIYYYYFYLSTSSDRPYGELFCVVAENMIFLSVIIYLCVQGHTHEAFFYWFIPARMALFFLSYGFNYLPHWPHDTRAEESPIRATRIVGNGSDWVAILLMGHDLHLVHHLFPGIPFYMYRKVLRRLVIDRPPEYASSSTLTKLENK